MKKYSKILLLLILIGFSVKTYSTIITIDSIEYKLSTGIILSNHNIAGLASVYKCDKQTGNCDIPSYLFYANQF